jgi:protein TonB
MRSPLFFDGLIVSRPRPLPPARRAAFLGAALFHMTIATLAAAASFLVMGIIPPPPAAASDSITIFQPHLGGPRGAGGNRAGQPAPRGGGAPRRVRAPAAPRIAPAAPAQIDAPAEGLEALPAGPGQPEGEGPGGPGGEDVGCPNCDGSGLGGPGTGNGEGPGSDSSFEEWDPRITLPVIVPASRAVPRYPDLARRARIEGSVILMITIAADGSVGEIEVLQGSDARWGFDLAAIEAVKRWRYRPGLLGGRPVAVRARVIVEFSLAR